MNNLTAFYHKARTDRVLKAELAEVTTAYVAGVIGVAGKHGVSLAAADFATDTQDQCLQKMDEETEGCHR
jgi:hypothetical protein